MNLPKRTTPRIKVKKVKANVELAPVEEPAKKKRKVPSAKAEKAAAPKLPANHFEGKCRCTDVGLRVLAAESRHEHGFSTCSWNLLNVIEIFIYLAGRTFVLNATSVTRLGCIQCIYLQMT